VTQVEPGMGQEDNPDRSIGTVRAVDLRRMLPTDHELVLALNNDNVPEVSALTRPELDRLVGLTSTTLVAELGGRFAGFALVMPPGVDYASLNYQWFSEHAARLGFGSFAYLDRIAIAPAARRHGIGRALYAQLVDELSGVAPVLFCEVNVQPRNEASLRFHEGIGFREVGQQDTDSGTKRVSLLALELAPAPM
jgi:predicted GNAT superfamily acetyltransferase